MFFSMVTSNDSPRARYTFPAAITEPILKDAALSPTVPSTTKDVIRRPPTFFGFEFFVESKFVLRRRYNRNERRRWARPEKGRLSEGTGRRKRRAARHTPAFSRTLIPSRTLFPFEFRSFLFIGFRRFIKRALFLKMLSGEREGVRSSHS